MVETGRSEREQCKDRKQGEAIRRKMIDEGERKEEREIGNEGKERGGKGVD